jgi:N-acyl-D-glutamate deacylase
MAAHWLICDHLGIVCQVENTSLIPARILEQAVPQMRDKGRIRVGADADIIVFDANTIADRATYQNPRIPSVGMRHVIVNGIALIQDGELHRRAMPGRAVRGPAR